MDSVLMNGINQMPIGWQIWINWMMLVNSISVFFLLKHKDARIILVVWLLNAGCMMASAEVWGYVRLLGLSHIVWWTPLMAYLIMNRKKYDLKTWFGRWIWIVIVTDCLSLVIDYIDVIRYIAGDRGSQMSG